MQYPGAIHYVMSRGDRREDIFLDDVDRQDFLKILAEACHKTGWQVGTSKSANARLYAAMAETAPGQPA